MTKALYYLILLISTYSFSQIKVDLIEVNQYQRDSIINIDSFSFKYFLTNNKLKKENNATSFNYSNLKLGKISQVDAFNALKTFVLYPDTNTVVLLDNRFAEIKIIDFNQLKNIKLVSHISNANNNSFWIFNTLENRLELFDYNTSVIKVKTNPITSNIIDITSDYNYVWLLTEESILCYNYAGSLIYKLKNDNYKALKNSNENLVFIKDNSLYLYNKGSKETNLIPLSHLLINSFFVSQQNLYIYELNKLYTYQLNY
jgi:hypothetical protein